MSEEHHHTTKQAAEAGGKRPVTARTRRRRRGTKHVLLTRDALDWRTNSFKAFARIADGIAADLGGAANLTTVQRHLVEAFAGAAIQVEDLNTRLVMGEKVDVLAHSNVISTLVRVASRIGLERIPRDVTPPTVADYLQHVNNTTSEATE